MASKNRAHLLSKRNNLDRVTKQKRRHRLAIAQLKKMTVDSKRQKREFEKKVSRLKLIHHKTILARNSKERHEKKVWQRKLVIQNRANQKRSEQEIARLKKNYQWQLEHIRDIYSNQAALLHNELVETIDKQSKVNRNDFESILVTSQRQLEKLQKWLQDELIKQLIEKRHNIENSDLVQVRLAADLKVKKLRDALDDREVELQQLQERLQKAEVKKGAGYARLLSRKMRGALIPNNECSSDPEPEDMQDAILNMIKEIAQEKSKMDKAIQMREESHQQMAS